MPWYVPSASSPVAERDEHLRAEQRGAHVRGRVRAVGVDVLPRPAVVGDLREGHLEVVEEVRVDLLVDRDARRRVRDVDENGAPAGVGADRAADVRGDVEKLRLALRRDLDLLHGGYPTRPMATASASSLDAYRDEADRFIAALDEEYYLHYAGLKESFELEPIYERFSDLTTLDAPRRLAEHAAGGGPARSSCGTSPARATSGT